MAAELIPSKGTMEVQLPKVIQQKFAKVTQADWVKLAFSTLNPEAVFLTGAADTVTFLTALVDNAGVAYDADTVSIVYDTAAADARPAGNYYIMTVSGELIFVAKDSGYDDVTGTLTVVRGALGTTPSATGIANNNTLYILCGLTLVGATTGEIVVTYTPLPENPGAGGFR